MTLYTDIDPSCCAVLNARVEDDSLPPGDVWCADVREIGGNDLREYTHVHLFAGMGGSPLGLSWAGWPTEWSIVTAGFPCQDVSSAGKGAGLDGARSGLYREAMRVIDIKKPMGCVIENVGALSARGLDRVAGALESLGYWVEALRMGAWAVGSPQERERWWFVCVRADAGEAVAGMPHRGLGTRGVRGGNGQAHGRDQSSAGGEGGELAGAAGGGRGQHEPGRGSETRTAVVGAGARVELANLRGGGQGAIGKRGAGAVADELGAGVKLEQPTIAGAGDRHRTAGGLRGTESGGHKATPVRQAHGAACSEGLAAGSGHDRASRARGGVGLATDAGREGHEHSAAGRERLSVEAGNPGRWPHRRHYVIDENGKERTVPTPQHDWEPSRLFNGTKTISAQWRLALMGYPLHWLDVPDAAIAALAGPRCKTPEKRAAWWNKQGIAMTGNAQVPQNVAVLAAAAVDAMKSIREEAAA